MADWIDAGRVKLIFKGDWISGKQYEVDDITTKKNVPYIAIKDNIGIDPETDTSKEYWQQFGPDVKIATKENAGITRPDGDTIQVEADGEINVLILSESEINEMFVDDIPEVQGQEG